MTTTPELWTGKTNLVTQKFTQIEETSQTPEKQPYIIIPPPTFTLGTIQLVQNLVWVWAWFVLHPSQFRPGLVLEQVSDGGQDGVSAGQDVVGAEVDQSVVVLFRVGHVFGCVGRICRAHVHLSLSPVLWGRPGNSCNTRVLTSQLLLPPLLLLLLLILLLLVQLPPEILSFWVHFLGNTISCNKKKCPFKILCTKYYCG